MFGFSELELKLKIKEYLKDFNNGKIDEDKNNDVFLLNQKLSWNDGGSEEYSNEEWHFNNQKNKRWFNEKDFLRYLKKINIDFNNNNELVIKNLKEIIFDNFRSGYDENNEKKSFLNFLKQEHEFKSISCYFCLIDLVNIENNVFTFKDEVRFKTEENKLHIFDLVLFVNGFPLVVIELKKKKIISAFAQIADYIKKCKSFFIPNLFSSVILEDSFYIGLKNSFTSKNKTANKWITQYTNINKDKKIKPENQIRSFITEVLAPERVLSFLNVFNYIYCIKTEEKTVLRERRICYAHQFQAAFEVLKRFKEKNKLGIIWHPTGTGKTTTMYYVTQLLLNWCDKELTFFVVTDRIELLDQAADYFQGSLGKNGKNIVHKVQTKKQLENNFKQEFILGKNTPFSYKGNVFIFNLQKIDKDLKALKDEIAKKDISKYVFLIDEAHRSHNDKVKKETFTSLDKDKDDPFSYSEVLWDVFSQSKFLGFTATIIKSKSADTEKKFGGITHEIKIDEAYKSKFYYSNFGYNLEISTLEKEIYKRSQEVAQIDPIIDNKIEEVKEKNLLIDKDVKKREVIKKTLVNTKIYEEKNYLKEAVKQICKDYKIDWNTKIWGKSLIVCRSINAAINVYDQLKNKAKTDKILQKEYDYYKELLKFNNVKKNLISYEEFCDNSIQIIFSKNFDASEDESIIEKIQQDIFEEKINEKIDKVRKNFKKVLNNGKDIKIVVVVNMLLVGYDCPPLENIYVLRELNEVNAVQLFGRVDRKYTFNILKNNIIEEVKKEYGRIVNYTKQDLVGEVNKYYKKNKDNYSIEAEQIINKSIILYVLELTKLYNKVLDDFMPLFWKKFYQDFLEIFYLIEKKISKIIYEAEQILDKSGHLYTNFRKKVTEKKEIEQKKQKSYSDILESLNEIKFRKIFEIIPSLNDVKEEFFNKFDFKSYKNTYDDFYLEYRMYFNNVIKKIDSYCRHFNKNIFQQIRIHYYKIYQRLHIFYWLDKIIKTEEIKIIKSYLIQEIKFFNKKREEVPFFVDKTQIIQWVWDGKIDVLKEIKKSFKQKNDPVFLVSQKTIFEKSQTIKYIKKYVPTEKYNETEKLFNDIFFRYVGKEENLTLYSNDIRIVGEKSINDAYKSLKEIEKLKEKYVPLKEKYFYYPENNISSEKDFSSRYYCYSNEVLYKFIFSLERAIRNYFKKNIQITKDNIKEFSKKFLTNYFIYHPTQKKNESIELTFSAKKSIKNNFFRLTRSIFKIEFKDCFDSNDEKDAFLENIFKIISELLEN